MYGQSRIKELTILSMSGSPKSQKKCRTDKCVKINSPHLTLMLWFKTELLIRARCACHSGTLRAILQNCGWLQIITFLIVPNPLPTIWKTNNSEDTNIQAACRVRNYWNRKRTFFWFRKKYCLRLPTNMIISILAILYLLIPPA